MRDPLRGEEPIVVEVEPPPIDADVPPIEDAPPPAASRNGHTRGSARAFIPPHDLEAEEAVLGAMLLGSETARACFEILSVDEFYSETHVRIADAVRRLLAEQAPVDPRSVWGALSPTERDELPGGAAYLATLYGDAPAAAAGPWHARTVAEHAQARRIWEATLRAQQAIVDERPSRETLAALRIELETLPPEPGAGRNLEVVSADKLCSLPVPDDEQLLGPMLLRGQRLVIGAHTGQGKTTFSLQAIAAVVNQTSFLGFEGQGGGRALVIDAEQGLRSMQRRLQEAGVAENTQIDILRVPDGLSLDTDAGQRREIEDIISSGYDVVLADPLYKLHGGDSNDERQAVDLMRYFDRLREEHRFALILPVHCRKPAPLGGRFTMHEFFGSGAYLRGAEVIIGIQMLRAGYSRLHWFKDRDGDLPVGQAWGLLFDRETGYRRDPADTEPRSTAADRVLEILQGTPGRTVEDLVEETKLAAKTVRRALKQSRCVAKKSSRGLQVWFPPAAEDDGSDPDHEPDLDAEAMF